MVRTMEKEKQQLYNTLRDLEWRMDQESKVWVGIYMFHGNLTPSPSQRKKGKRNLCFFCHMLNIIIYLVPNM